METSKINDILQSIESFSLEDQSFIAETLNKRLRDLRRNQIAIRAKEAEENYKLGKVTTGTVADLMKVVTADG